MIQLLVVDKPGGITSRDAVNRAQRWFPPGTRVGHTGTLDPLATGVLVLCLGTATRLTEYVQAMTKTYRTRLLLGARSDTDDADGVMTPVPGAAAPEANAIEQALSSLVGEISQVPPAYSAAKVVGRRAYHLARSGAEVRLEPRRVRVWAINLLAYRYPHLDLQVQCGKGTYIRSLARDLGERLGCGALVEQLRRTRVGPFTDVQAVPLDADLAEIRARLLPAAMAVADLPRLQVDANQAGRLRHGQGLRLGELACTPGPAGEVALFLDQELVAVASWEPNQQVLKPTKVFR